ncbi:hypothetical protein FACS1894166_11120 [Bacilli bacterium]|nr:hypothetical protein FACS1894166_11120 [Bacilli bacterium]
MTQIENTIKQLKQHNQQLKEKCHQLKNMVQQMTVANQYVLQPYVEQLLAVVPLFESAVQQEEKLGHDMTGMKMIQNMYRDILARMQVVIISPQPGDEFDAQIMEGINPVQLTAPKVKKVLMLGYKLEDRVLLPAKVELE